jgi:endoglucanase
MKFRTLILALASVVGMSYALTPVETYGTLKAKNGTLVGKGGKTAILRGMSMYWSSEPVGYNYYTDGVVKWLQSDFQASVIRVPLAVEAPANSPNSGYLTGVVKDSVTNLTRVKTIINSCISQGLYVVVDWHAPTDNPYTDHAKAFFVTLAQAYKNVPNIMWEVWNEPTVDNGTVKTHADAVIAALRAVGDTNLVIVGSSSWSAQPDQVPSVADSKNNVAYSIHFYTGSPAHDAYKTNVTNAIKAGRTVFATEWGTSDATGKYNFNASTSTSWLDFLETNGVSHCNWNIGAPLLNTSIASMGVEASAALKSGSNFSGGWDITGNSTMGLTPSGIYIRNYIRNKNGAFTLPADAPDTSAIPGSFYATRWSKVSGVDSAASTDTAGKQMVNVTSGSSAEYYLKNTGSSFYYSVQVRLKATTAGNIVFKTGTTALCTLAVPAGQGWVALRDTVYLATGVQTLHADFNFAGNVAFYKFSKNLSAPPSTGLAGMAHADIDDISIRGNVASFQDGHSWSAMKMVDAHGAVMHEWSLSPSIRQIELPRAQGVRWLLISDKNGLRSSVAVPPLLK